VLLANIIAPFSPVPVSDVVSSHIPSALSNRRNNDPIPMAGVDDDDFFFFLLLLLLLLLLMLLTTNHVFVTHAG
jgi:hypothetical protein